MSSVVSTSASTVPRNEMDEFEDWYMGESG